MLTAVLIVLASVLAFAMSAVVGGGASIILIPVLALSLPISEVPSALVIGTLTSSASRTFTFWKMIRWNLVVVFVPAAIPAVVIGAYLLRYVDPLVITWLCSLFLISNIPALLRDTSSQPVAAAPVSRIRVALIGFVAGLVSGVTGAVGLMLNGFYLRSGLSKEEIVATRAANEILLHLLKLILYVRLGLFSTSSICIGLLVALAAIASSAGMRVVLPRVSDGVFRRVGYAAMICSGVFLLLQTSATIRRERSPDVKLVSVTDGFETKIRWGTTSTALEVEYGGEISVERVIGVTDLPAEVGQRVSELASSADRFLVEEVFAWRVHYFEVYVEKDGRVAKYEIAARPARPV